MADGDDDGSKRKKLGVRQVAQRAGGELEQLLGRPVSSVLGVQKDDGNWNVTLEIIEVDRIPETTSIMGVYRVVLDEDGDVLEYTRTRRYHRGQPSEDG
jgi:Gas vesicle synthesis protein GvpO